MTVTIERLNDDDSTSPWNPLRTATNSDGKLRTCAYRIHGNIAPESTEECDLMVPLPFRGAGFDFYKRIKHNTETSHLRSKEYVLELPPRHVTIDIRFGNYCVLIEPVPLLIFASCLTVDFPVLNLGMRGRFILSNLDKRWDAPVDFKLVGIELSRN